MKSNELQGGNTTGTQTFSGPISGGGSLRRTAAGGETVFSGHNTFSGGTTVDDGTLYCKRHARLRLAAAT